MTTPHTLAELLEEYERALAYTDRLWTDLTPDELRWRPNEHSSAIAWHVGHQAAVAHYLVRNLMAAEPLIDPELDSIMDSSTHEPDRGDPPGIERLARYRATTARRVRFRVDNLAIGRVCRPSFGEYATTMMTAIVNHEYQHSKWIGEVRSDTLHKPLPDTPDSTAIDAARRLRHAGELRRVERRSVTACGGRRNDGRHFRNLRRGVVGEHLAVGLAGRAVGDRVAAVADRADRVAAHRARLADAAVHAVRADRPTSSCPCVSARRPGRRRRTRGSPPRRRRRPPARACRSSRTATAWRGGRSRWPAFGPARRCSAGRAGSRARACSWPRTRSRSSSAVTSVGLGAEPVERLHVERPVGRDAPDAGPALVAGLGEQQRRAFGEHEAGLAVAGFGDASSSTSSRPPCIRWTDERHGSNAQQQVLAAPADGEQRRGRTPSSGAGDAVFNAVKCERRRTARARRRGTAR